MYLTLIWILVIEVEFPSAHSRNVAVMYKSWVHNVCVFMLIIVSIYRTLVYFNVMLSECEKEYENGYKTDFLIYHIC